MKDMGRPRDSIFKSFSEGLVQKHPKAFNVFLILALVSLLIAGAFLLSDIMSFKSNAAQKGPFTSLYLEIPKENPAVLKTWQEKGTNLIDQLKSILGMKGPEKAAVKGANRDKARDLLAAKNRLAKAKEAKTENLSHRKNSVVSLNSSRTLTSVQPLKVTNAITIGGGESGGSTVSPYHSGGDSSPNNVENSHLVAAVTSNISENQLSSNRSTSDESVSNESVVNISVSNDSLLSAISELALNEHVANESVSNDSLLSAISEPALNERVSNESVSNESIRNEPVINESGTNKSAIIEPALNEFVSNESVSNESLRNEPVINESGTNKSAIIEPALNEHVSNESASNDSLRNEPVINESCTNKSAIIEPASNEQAMNKSQTIQSNTDQSELCTNLSSNTTYSHPSADQEINSAGNNSSYTIVARNSNLSFDDSASGFVTAEIRNSTAQDKSGSAASGPSEFNITNNEICNRNETSDLKTNTGVSQDEKAKNESEGSAALNQRSNITSDTSAPSSNEIPSIRVPEKASDASNITSNQIAKSPDPDSNPIGDTLSANNSTSQFKEPEQNQTYNRSDSKPLSDGSSIALPQPNNNTEGLQRHAETNKNTENKVSTSTASAKPQESNKVRLVNSPNIRNLKVPKSSSITKFEPKNKRN